jgi:hypothetical protein
MSAHKQGFAVAAIVLIWVITGGVLFAYNARQPSQQSTPCVEPLSLVEVRVVAPNSSVTQPSLDFVWHSCEQVDFNQQVSPLNVTVGVSGYESTASAISETYVGAFSAQQNENTSVVLPLVYTSEVSSNATVLHVSGSVYAIDPVTNRALSAVANFTT